jgi:hypothetical protein
MVYIPAGAFEMGIDIPESYPDEKPRPQSYGQRILHGQNGGYGRRVRCVCEVQEMQVGRRKRSLRMQ